MMGFTSAVLGSWAPALCTFHISDAVPAVLLAGSGVTPASFCAGIGVCLYSMVCKGVAVGWACMLLPVI